jgi:hypothetical protein
MQGCCVEEPTRLPDGHLGKNPHGPYRAEPNGTQLHAHPVPLRESCVLVWRVGLAPRFYNTVAPKVQCISYNGACTCDPYGVLRAI